MASLAGDDPDFIEAVRLATIVLSFGIVGYVTCFSTDERLSGLDHRA